MNIQENISLKEYTTFKIGGPAKFFVEVKDETEFDSTSRLALANKWPIFILGGGSNILVSDKGFDGLVVKITNSEHSIEDNIIKCGAGMLLSEVVFLALKNGLSGLEWAVGIPGRLGGAVRGNAGAYGSCMSDIVDEVKVTVFDDCRMDGKILANAQCNFGYRTSLIKQQKKNIVFLGNIKTQKGRS